MKCPKDRYTGGSSRFASIASNEPMCGEQSGGPELPAHKKRQDSLSLNEVGFLTRGRPLGRTVDCKPNRLTVDSTHSRFPKGHPLLAESRTADISFSVSGWLTRSFQPRGRGIGQEESKGGFGLGFWFQCQRDPQRHSSARETKSARSAFRSTYRQTVRKCSSSWIGKLLNRR